MKDVRAKLKAWMCKYVSVHVKSVIQVLNQNKLLDLFFNENLDV